MRIRTLAAALLLAPAACARDSAPGTRHVVLVSIDGFPAYSLEDPFAPAPTLRRLACEGASAARGMTVVNPSVTWPNHATLATGVSPARHGVLFNGLLVRDGPGRPVRVEQCGRDRLLRAPAVYDLAHRAGLSTAQVDWVPWQTGGTITWAFEERPDPEGALERELVAAGVLEPRDVAQFRRGNAAWRDEIWTRAAAYLLRTHRPRLLLVHLLNLDAVHHRYGPRTPAGLSAIALADARVAELLAALDDAGLRDRTAFFAVSDHGFKTVRRILRPNALLRREGLLEAQGGKVVSADAHVYPEGGTAMVYATRPERRDAVLARLRELFRSLEGIERVIEPAEFAALGLPAPADNPQMGDLFLAAKPGYAFNGSPDGEPVADADPGYLGTHGYLASDPEMNALFVAWGSGIRPGVRPETVRNLDVAPTIAALLGLRLDGVEGRALADILR
jgi:predicted AlkP superfamily pyrophosphatase or phosphodiesterase